MLSELWPSRRLVCMEISHTEDVCVCVCVCLEMLHSKALFLFLVQKRKKEETKKSWRGWGSQHSGSKGKKGGCMQVG